MTEWRPAGQAKALEGNVQAVEAGTGILGSLQGLCPVLQGLGQEGQGPDGAELGKGCREY